MRTILFYVFSKHFILPSDLWDGLYYFNKIFKTKIGEEAWGYQPPFLGRQPMSKYPSISSLQRPQGLAAMRLKSQARLYSRLQIYLINRVCRPGKERKNGWILPWGHLFCLLLLLLFIDSLQCVYTLPPHFFQSKQHTIAFYVG